ncbi:MAG: Ig domain-containing protein [Isosphaeraceae bacterium]
MRRSRRGGHGGLEFGGSGEDSFVAVVVTKLTGALLFILLLTMVIMALIPKADQARPEGQDGEPAAPLAITTPPELPEAIAGRPYNVALAAVGGQGSLRWALDGPLPKGLSFDPNSARLHGTPSAGTPRPVELVLRVSDGSDRDARAARLTVYQPNSPLTLPSRWAPGLPPIPWRAWLEQGFGFLVLLLVYQLGMTAVNRLERLANDPDDSSPRRFLLYRILVRSATLGSAAALAVWLWRQRVG